MVWGKSVMYTHKEDFNGDESLFDTDEKSLIWGTPLDSPDTFLLALRTRSVPSLVDQLNLRGCEASAR